MAVQCGPHVASVESFDREPAVPSIVSGLIRPTPLKLILAANFHCDPSLRIPPSPSGAFAHRDTAFNCGFFLPRPVDALAATLERKSERSELGPEIAPAGRP